MRGKKRSWGGTHIICAAGLVLSVTLPTIALGQSLSTRQTANAIIDAWTGWMSRHDIAQGAIAISKDGRHLADEGIGRTATDPAPVASLSKAITAVCALKALEAAGKDHTLKLSDAMKGFFSQYRARDRRLFVATVGHLITHDSGIQSQFFDRYTRFKTFEEAQKELQMRTIALERLGNVPGRSNYRYSNANYLALGIVIEELTGEAYGPYCERTVLKPLGIETARLSKAWRVTSSFGGWEISAKDYLTFLHDNFGAGAILGQSPTRFQPRVHIGRNRFYGPGVLFRKTDKGTLIWHAGSWRWTDDSRDDRFGAYFLMLDNGIAMSINFSDDAGEGRLEELERLIWEAARS